MDILEYILYPVYVLIFYFIFSSTRKKIDDPILKKYHRQGFWIKIFSTLCFTIFSLYISPGDSIALYYPEGVNMFHLFLKDFTNLKYLFVAGKDFDVSLLPTIP